jgi:SNF2 family DNA or RNA helicase
MIIKNDFVFITQEFKELDSVFVKSMNMFRIPLNLHSVRELYKRLQTDELLELGKKLRQNYDEKLSLKTLSDTDGDKRLRPYQRVDLAFLRTLPHKAIFNQQRTGKTPLTLQLIVEEGHKKTVIVCPSSLKLNWQDEINNWIGYESIIANGTPTQRAKLYNQFYASSQAILIISYETLRNDISLFKKAFECLVLDESHRIRNIKTKQTKAVNQLGRLADVRIALTGTPAVNHASDVFGILHFLYPKQFPSYWQFSERYFHVKDGFFGKELGRPKRQSELDEILQLLSTQRKRKDIMKWIPDVSTQIIRLEGDKQQLSAYNQMLKTFEIEQDGKLLVDASSPLAQLTRLRQIALYPPLLEINAKSPKEDFIMDYISDNPNEPIIIYSSFTSYLKVLQGKIAAARMVIGEQSTLEKQNNVRDFQKGKFNVLLANIISAGTGFTIDRAETIIYLDKSFNLIDNEQSADRFIPTLNNGNDKKRTIIELVIKDTVDEKINRLLADKKSIVELVNTYGIGAILK